MSVSVRYRGLFGILAFASVMAGSVHAKAVNTAVIGSVQADFTTGILTIEGANLPAAPDVFLSSLPLLVLTAGPSEIQTQLPAGIPRPVICSSSRAQARMPRPRRSWSRSAPLDRRGLPAKPERQGFPGRPGRKGQ